MLCQFINNDNKNGIMIKYLFSVLLKLFLLSVSIQSIHSRDVTSTNNSGRLLTDKNSTRHRALAKFNIHLNRKQHPIFYFFLLFNIVFIPFITFKLTKNKCFLFFVTK